MATFSTAYESARLPTPALVTEHATPAAAFAAARQTYLSGERLDMRALATELGVARTTLYRWSGGRDQLLIDVIWDLSETLIGYVWEQTAALEGIERLIEALRRYTETVAHSYALRAFLRNETHAAMRLLTTRGGFQDRLVDAMARLIAQEQTRARFELAADPALLAYAAVRVVEGFVYNDALAAVEPAVEDAITILRLILH